MPENPEQTLDDAVARNLGAVLSLPSAGMLRHHKSRFLEATDEGIWIEAAPEDRGLIDDLIARAQPAAVSFKSATAKVSFAGLLLKRDEQRRISESVAVEAVLVRRPTQIKSVQRRNDYRVRTTAESDLKVRVWRIAEQFDLRETPPAAQELPIDLRDISLGGLGITLHPPTEAGDAQTCAIRLMMDERLRIEFQTGDQQMIVEGRVRHLPPELSAGKATAPARVGVQFSKLEAALAGRQTIAVLTRIVGQLQRDEVRRARLGLTSGDAAA